MERVERLLRLPGVRMLYRHHLDRQFKGPGLGSFNGVYQSFAEAKAAAPKTKPFGYDSVGPASLYRDRLHRVYPSDYPALLWLDRLIRGGNRRIVDVGGHVGVAYYSFRRYIELPDDLTWTVVDVPAVAKAGTELAERQGVGRQLKFESDLACADGADVLFAAGSLQYVETPLWETLGKFRSKPATLVINNLPVRNAPTFVTLQNIGVAYCAYLVFGRAQLLEGFRSQGYEEHDRWEVYTHRCHQPLNPEYGAFPYSGFLFSSERSPLGTAPLKRLAEDARDFKP